LAIVAAAFHAMALPSSSSLLLLALSVSPGSPAAANNRTLSTQKPDDRSTVSAPPLSQIAALRSHSITRAHEQRNIPLCQPHQLRCSDGTLPRCRSNPPSRRSVSKSSSSLSDPNAAARRTRPVPIRPQPPPGRLTRLSFARLHPNARLPLSSILSPPFPHGMQHLYTARKLALPAALWKHPVYQPPPGEFTALSLMLLLKRSVCLDALSPPRTRPMRTILPCSPPCRCPCLGDSLGNVPLSCPCNTIMAPVYSHDARNLPSQTQRM